MSRPLFSASRRNLSPLRERLKKRNRAVAARYYYWTELCRRREDDCRDGIKILKLCLIFHGSASC